MQPTRWILAALALLLAAGALWLALRDPAVGRERARLRPRVEPAPEAEPGRLRPPPERAEPGTEPRDASEPASASARVPVDVPAPDARPAERFLEVEVVEARSLARVPGAALFGRGGDGADPLTLGPLEEALAPYRTDSAGLARVPASAENGVLAARAGRLTGVVRVEDATAGPVRIELHPDFDVAVLVRHAGGAPAVGVPVGLGVPPAPRWRASERETDAEGRVTFAHVGLKMALEREPAGEVRVQRALDAPLTRAFDLQGPPPGPVVFVLPHCASVSVRLTDAEGQPVADGTALELAHLPPGTERDLSPFARGEREYLQASTQGGLARFECVELGGELEILVHADGRGVLLRAFRPAPARAGGHEEHALALERAHPVLVFRVLDAAGVVLASEELSLHQMQRSGWSLGEDARTLTTDADGRFRLELVDPFREGDQHQLTVEARANSIGALVDLARPFEPGEVPMGDLRLVPPPLLAEGRVVDAEGVGVPATLVLHYPVREQDGRSVWYWSQWERGLATRPDGAFEVRGFLEKREFRLHAEADGLRSDALELARGARGLELLLLSAGWIEGSVRLDEGVPSKGIELTLRPSGARGNVPEESRAELTPDGRFHFADLAPGRFDLSLGVRGQDGVARVEGLVVPPGAACSDPRLALDLRGRIHWMRFVLVPPGPVDELSGSLQYWPSGSGGEPRHYHWFEGSPIDLLALYERVDLACTVPGYRPVHLADVSAGQEILLQPALTARLQLPPGVRLPEPPLYVKATLVIEGQEGGLDFGGAAFDEGREILCRAPGPGRLLVRWIAERRGSGGASATTMEGIPAQYVELVEDAGEPLFMLTVEDAALQDALSKTGL